MTLASNEQGSKGGLTKIELKLVERASEFDMPALLSMLRRLGFMRDDILFRGNSENINSHTLIHSLKLERKPQRRAIITCNLGLLGPNGLLPSYFTQVAEQTADPDRLHDFMAFFEHRLLEAFFSASYPELSGGLYRDYRAVQRSFFRMLGPASVSTLHWLFALYFPELRVSVGRRQVRAATNSHALRIGSSRLDGTAVVGRLYESEGPGFTVHLWSDEEVRSDGHAWPHVTRDRLIKLVLPELAAFDVPLVVVLHVKPHASWAELNRGGYLGYERIRGSEEDGHQIVIFHGRSSQVLKL